MHTLIMNGMIMFKRQTKTWLCSWNFFIFLMYDCYFVESQFNWIYIFFSLLWSSLGISFIVRVLSLHYFHVCGMSFYITKLLCHIIIISNMSYIMSLCHKVAILPYTNLIYINPKWVGLSELQRCFYWKVLESSQ